MDVCSLLPGLDWIERENFLDVHLTRNRPPPARRRRSGPTQRTSFRRAGQSLYTAMKRKNKNKTALAQNNTLNVHSHLKLSDLPSPNPLPQLFQQHTVVSDWPEQVEFHPFSAEEESELGYMDDPYHEETYEDLLTPSFFSLERDTLQIVEVTQTSIIKIFKFYYCKGFNIQIFFFNHGEVILLHSVLFFSSGWRRTQSDGKM